MKNKTTLQRDDFRIFYAPASERIEMCPISEISNPREILNMFFNDFSFDGAKRELWIFLKAALGDTSDSKPEHFIYFYERLCDMMTAAYLVAHERNMAKEKTGQSL